jgi:hypothetical protein
MTGCESCDPLHRVEVAAIDAKKEKILLACSSQAVKEFFRGAELRALRERTGRMTW